LESRDRTEREGEKFLVPKKGRPSRRTAPQKRYSIAHDPEVVRQAHLLFVVKRLGFRQIAGELKLAFGLGARLDSLARTVKRWADADGELWYREREEQYRRDTAIRHDGEKLIAELLEIAKLKAEQIKAAGGGGSSAELNAFTGTVKQLHAYYEARAKEQRADIIITGDKQFILLMRVIQEAVGIKNWQEILPGIARRYEILAAEYGVKSENEHNPGLLPEPA
jgi:hypothetical protein